MRMPVNREIRKRMSTPSDKLEITLSMVKDLIAEQFPQWVNLEIKPVEISGWDN